MLPLQPLCVSQIKWKRKNFYTYPFIGGLPNNFPYSSHFLCCHYKYKMNFMKFEISLFLPLCLGSHNWVSILAIHHLFQSLLAHPLNAALLPRLPFQVFDLAGLFSFKAVFLFFLFQWKTKYKFSYNESKLQCIHKAKSIQEMRIRKHEQASNRFPYACFSWWVARGCSATLTKVGSLVTLDMSIRAQRWRECSLSYETPMLKLG